MKAPNGAIYVCAARPAADYDLTMFKCADPDTGSFSEQDSADRPATANISTNWMHCCQYEHLIFAAYGVLDGSEHDIVETTFNTATDQWEGSTRTIYSGGPGDIPGAWYPCALVATPNYLYCLHPSDDEKVHGTAYARCMVSYRDLDGTTWNNSAELNSGNQSDCVPMGLAVNESENAVIFYETGGNTMVGRAWDRSSFGTATSGLTLNGVGQCVSYMDSSTNRIILVFGASTAVYAKRYTSTGTTVTALGTSETIETSVLASDRPGLARWGTTLYAWYVNGSDNPAYEDSTDHAVTWSGAQHSNPSNNVTEHPWANAYTRKGQLRIGIVYKEGTTQLSYDERAITNVTAPAFGSARTPVRQNRIFVDA
jgi:hypothetical protein